MSHGKNFIIVLNNYTTEEYTHLSNWGVAKCVYFIIGEEVGEEGTPHLQCYFQVGVDIRFSTLKKLFPRAHIESAHGSFQDNYDYIVMGLVNGQPKTGTIDPDPLIWGEPRKKGQRSDLNSLGNDIINGKKVPDIALENPGQYIRYHKGINALATIANKPKMRPDIKVIWLTGKTGVGKTLFAFEHFEDPFIKDTTRWWDGYDDESNDVIVIDDFEGDWELGFRDLLRLFQEYPFRGWVKGGSTPINCQTIIITSDKTPSQCFHNLDYEKFSQIERRIHFVLEVVRDVEGNTRYLNIRDEKKEIEIE